MCRGIGEGDHARCGLFEGGDETLPVSLIEVNPDGGAGALLVAGDETLAIPLEETTDGTGELARGGPGGDETIGARCISFGKGGHAGGNAVFVAEVAHACFGPIGDPLVKGIAGVIFDMPGADEAFGVEDGGDFVIGAGLGQGADAVEQGWIRGMAGGRALGGEGGGSAAVPTEINGG